MKKPILAILTFAIIVSLSTNILLAQTKTAAGGSIGIVDVEAIVKEIPEAVQADKDLSDMSKKYQDSILAKRKDLETRYQNYTTKQKSMMAPDKQAAEEDKYGKEMQDLQQYATEKQQEIDKYREQLLTPIRAKVKNAIEAVAKDEKLSLVLSKDAQSIVIYFEPKLDITFRVIDNIKRGS
ncbi:MAG: OmpH family outer membrane protein [Ignavibacteria bacterium]|jgi:Skp family chaperone for outer membrane proteins|nr:OmpH family outer membrane protein [Ignavibacteria bacterium]